ncbi:hypothetical protein DXG03_005220 [Asterophora parasitica]|uniref:Xanthine/uracil permease n=1 Tax=Asterophora parasitica TaxID=117018 RepID=A0A9P7KB34_9AGAR|nr:hypothetical protein DXG03_005220 [Asterophora parasitica]
MVRIIDKLNNAVADSFVGRYFKLDGSGAAKMRVGSRFTVCQKRTRHRISCNTERAALDRDSCWPYNLDSGGPCVCPTNDLCIKDDVYAACVAEVRLDFITTTAAIAALASFLMGLLANLPVGLAPGLGLNAYFAYSVVGFHGSGIITYGEALALAAVFLEGWLFLFLSLLGLRQWLASSSAGAHQSLLDSTIFSLMDVGRIVTALLMLYRVRGAILIGIFLVSIVSWPRPSAVTYFPHTPAGDALFDYFKKVVTFHPISKIGGAINVGVFQVGFEVLRACF